MTAEELRQITKVSLLNPVVIKYIDGQLVKAAKEGDYSCVCDMIDSRGYSQPISETQYFSLRKHYTDLGFRVNADPKPGSDGKYHVKKITFDWSAPTSVNVSADTNIVHEEGVS